MKYNLCMMVRPTRIISQWCDEAGDILKQVIQTDMGASVMAVVIEESDLETMKPYIKENILSSDDLEVITAYCESKLQTRQ